MKTIEKTYSYALSSTKKSPTRDSLVSADHPSMIGGSSFTRHGVLPFRGFLSEHI